MTVTIYLTIMALLGVAYVLTMGSAAAFYIHDDEDLSFPTKALYRAGLALLVVAAGMLVYGALVVF